MNVGASLEPGFVVAYGEEADGSKFLEGV